jgi:FtsP/CotA-like multicopper oxidase with cupredoxin domain
VRFGEGDPVQKYYQSGLINGRGRYDDNEAPLEVFTVTSGQRYRFRMIGTGMMHPWEVSIDQHRLTVIASDGIDIEHVIVDSIIINPGERYDFILNATEPVDRYRIRGRMLSEEGTYGTIIMCIG